jgi:YidC/Oxa1 family membrane protein insertase
MDFRRTILMVVFAMSLLLLWERWLAHQGQPSMFGAPPATQTDKKGEGKAEAAPAGGAAVPAAATPTPGAATGAAGAAVPAATAPSATPPAERVRIETDVFRGEIDPVGAALVRAELLKEKVAPDWTAAGLAALVTGKKPPADSNEVLLDNSKDRVYIARTGITAASGARYPNHLTPFTLVSGPRTLEPGQDKLELRFEAEGNGLKVAKTYLFHRGRYDIEVRHEIVNTGTEPVAPSVYLQLVRDGNKPAGDSSMYATFTGPAVYTDSRKFQKVSFDNIAKGKTDIPAEAKDGWIGIIQHYFATAWVPPQGAPRELRTAQEGPNLYSVSSVLPLAALAPGQTVTHEAKLWVGPQDQAALAKLAPGLELVVDYGWLTMIAKPLYWLLSFLHGLVGNWGWAIVLLTVIVKVAFYPLSAASYKSMAKMKDLAPRVAKLREQYGNDRNKLNAAMMEIYKNEKINPLGGCLPILVQIPVFIALYWVLLASVEIRNQPWILWVKDLATPDPWFILPAIMVATMVLQMRLSPPPPDPMQAKVMKFMPYIFGAMMFLFPSGLVLYWTVNNLLSIAQQWWVTKQIEKAKPVG